MTLPSGVVVTPEEVIAKGRKGRKMTILGDTSDASWMLNAARDSDLIVHEVYIYIYIYIYISRERWIDRYLSLS